MSSAIRFGIVIQAMHRIPPLCIHDDNDNNENDNNDNIIIIGASVATICDSSKCDKFHQSTFDGHQQEPLAGDKSS
jgi:hypothetical protein